MITGERGRWTARFGPQAREVGAAGLEDEFRGRIVEEREQQVLDRHVLMARLAGMTLEDRWSDWHRQPFGPTSTEHITIYRAN